MGSKGVEETSVSVDSPRHQKTMFKHFSLVSLPQANQPFGSGLYHQRPPKNQLRGTSYTVNHWLWVFEEGGWGNKWLRTEAGHSLTHHISFSDFISVECYTIVIGNCVSGWDRGRACLSICLSIIYLFSPLNYLDNYFRLLCLRLQLPLFSLWSVQNSLLPGCSQTFPILVSIHDISPILPPGLILMEGARSWC